MKYVLLTLLMAFLFIAAPHKAEAQASYKDGALVSQEVIAPLMRWVEAQTGVRVPYLPKVLASRSQLVDIVGKMDRLPGRARALYTNGTVVLDHQRFDSRDSTQLSLLVHELVHFAQSFRNQSAYACAQAKEVEAYQLQNKWLEERGHRPFVRASWIERVSTCPATPARTIAVAAAY
ncbi:MAG: hypothetical protein FWF24_00855 [Alphaproteobacteria bacterium]|nr:hypothetical protein [Alphaproteobacteria bacterium]